MAFTALNNLMHVPPGGWKYTQSETQALLHGGDYYELVEKVRRHRHLNYLDTANLDAQVQAQICEKMPDETRAVYCQDNELLKKAGERVEVSYGDVKHFLETIAGLRRFVPAKEANRRAEICANCPRNSPVGGCSTCRSIVGLIFNVIGQRKTPLDSRLGACGVCGCELKASVHIPLETFPQVKGHVYPDWCWRAQP